MKFSLNYTSIHLNICGLMRIRLHTNKTSHEGWYTWYGVHTRHTCVVRAPCANHAQGMQCASPSRSRQISAAGIQSPCRLTCWSWAGSCLQCPVQALAARHTWPLAPRERDCRRLPRATASCMLGWLDFLYNFESNRKAYCWAPTGIKQRCWAQTAAGFCCPQLLYVVSFPFLYIKESRGKKEKKSRGNPKIPVQPKRCGR